MRIINSLLVLSIMLSIALCACNNVPSQSVHWGVPDGYPDYWSRTANNEVTNTNASSDNFSWQQIEGMFKLFQALVNARPDNVSVPSSDNVSTPSSDNVSTISSDNVSASIPVEKLDVYLLVQDNCLACAKATAYLTGLEKEYPIKLIALNVNGSDHMRCIELCKEYGISPTGVPVLFLSKYWLIGWGKVAEEPVRNWVEECTAGMVVDVKASGNVNVDIGMAGPGVLSVESKDPSKVDITVDDKVKTITTEHAR